MALVPITPGVPAVVAPPALADMVPRFLRWYQFVRERAEHTIEAYSYDLQSFLQFAERIGVADPRLIRVQLVEAYLATLRHEKHLSAQTVNRRRACLVAFFKYLVREEIILVNPAAETQPLKKPRRLPKRLTLRERNYVLDAMAEDTTPLGRRDLAIVGVGSLAGLRCEEIVTLPLVDVNLEDRLIRVIGKGDKQREVPIVSRLHDILVAYLAARPALVGRPMGEVYRRTASSIWRLRYPTPDGADVRVNTYTYSRSAAVAELARLAPKVPASPYLFVNAAPRRSHALRRGGHPLLTRSLFAMVRRKVSPLVGRPVSPHQLRHTFASVLTERGANAFHVQHAMGHERMDTTAIYVHLGSDALRAEIEKHIG